MAPAAEVEIRAATGEDAADVARLLHAFNSEYEEWTPPEEELYVVPALRGRGIGRALLEATMESARSRGATHIELTTGETDAEARGLYESSGFSNREGSPDGPRMLYYEREL